MGVVIDFIERLMGRRADGPFPVPWVDGRRSIYAFLREQSDGRERLPPDAFNLPDEADVHSTSSIRWAPGALDGVFNHHVGNERDADVAKLLAALKRASARPTRKTIGELYALALDDGALGLADPLSEAIRTDKNIDAERLNRLAYWLATEAPDRGPVKFGIVLLGLFRDESASDIFRTLGRHDEFTLYAAVALGNAVPHEERDRALWDLAKSVHGWGRIHTVERLADTDNAAIKRWLLREGFRNSVMYEYLAHICATTGELRSALDAPEVDDDLIRGAGELLEALIAGGPAENMDTYADGAEATRLYLEHLLRRAPTDLAEFLTVDRIREYVADRDTDSTDASDGRWSKDTRRQIADACAEILARPEWHDMALQGLHADGIAFWHAATAAPKLGIDAWPYHFERQRARIAEDWYHLMQTDDPVRIDRALDLARQQIAPKTIATGAGHELGLGPAFVAHSALDYILQRIVTRPGVGWDFIATGLKSPVIRNRNFAVRALDGWGETKWPTDARVALEAARDVEPDDDVRRRIDNVLAGRPLD